MAEPTDDITARWSMFISDRFWNSREHRGLSLHATLVLVQMAGWCAAHEATVIPASALRFEMSRDLTAPEIDEAAELLESLGVWARHEPSGGWRWSSPHFKLTRSIAGRGCGVYYLFAGQEIVYIGMGTTPDTRIGEHIKTFGGMLTDVAVDWFPTRREAAAEEAFMIRLFQPPGNITGAQSN